MTVRGFRIKMSDRSHRCRADTNIPETAERPNIGLKQCSTWNAWHDEVGDPCLGFTVDLQTVHLGFHY